MAPDLPFVHGPEIGPDSGLLEWLASLDPAHSVVALPVRMGRPFERDLPRLVTADARAQMSVQLDDSALGIALADRMAGDGADHPRAGWLEGTWNSVTRPPTMRVTRWVRALTSNELETPAHARLAVAVDSDRSLVAALEQLGGPSTSAKEAASKFLVAAGTTAIPLLIASLADGRTFAVRDTVNRINLPHHERPGPKLAARSVGTHCSELLHRIVTPPPTAAIDYRGKVFSTQVLSISDWNAFWARRSDRSLTEIHEELAPLVDAYWTQRGTPQRVD